MVIKDPKLLIEALKWQQEQPEVFKKINKFMMDHPGIVLKFMETNEIDECDKNDDMLDLIIKNCSIKNILSD